MKIRVKKVYYCDYCKKHSLRPLAQHEKYCTGNLDRECRMCNRKPSKKLRVLARYIRMKKINKADDIMELVDYCPACTLTLIRANGLQHFPNDLRFDYDKEVKDFWHNKNEEDRQAEENSILYDTDW